MPSTTERKAYSGTQVGVEKSRAAIAKILQQWGASGVQWEDDLRGNGMATLRFRWPHKGAQLVVRIRLTPTVRPIRGTKAAEKKLENERKRLHRVAYFWLKSQHEAVEAGLFKAEEVILPWLEDSEGNTLGEAIRPHLADFETADFRRRLQLPALRDGR